MADEIREVMTPEPLLLQKDATATEAAMAMAGADIGDVLVVDGDSLFGIVTDRDLAVRVVAESRDPAQTTLDEICTRDPATLSPDDRVERALELSEREAVRRIPVVDGSEPVGVVSLGDLAIGLQPESVLAKVSASDPNR